MRQPIAPCRSAGTGLLLAAAFGLLLGFAAHGVQPANATQPAAVSQSQIPLTPVLSQWESGKRSTLPLFFEPGAAADGIVENFVARGPNYHFNITAAQLDFALRSGQISDESAPASRTDLRSLISGPARLVRMTLVGANRNASLSGTGEMQGKVNYFVGNDPARWRSQVPMFGGVHVEELYPGISLNYYGNQRQIEYDFALAAKADPSLIGLHFEGVEKLSISQDGELVISVGDGQLVQHRPIIYQIIKNIRHEVAGAYALKDPHTAAFDVGTYDHDWPLVIDPVFSYSTYFGGNGGDTGLATKVDSNGSVYLAGETLSTKFPPASSTNSFQSQWRGGSTTGDAFVAKLDSTGSQLLYFTYLGGSGDDGALDLAVDAAGNAFITGFTVSPDFPTRNALFSQISGSPDPTFNLYPNEAFVAELNADGSALVYSTYLGGSGNDVGSGIALDPAGYAYVTGLTFSTNFPLVNAYQPYLNGNDDAFVAKFAPGGHSLVYSTYLGGFSIDEGEGIAADSAGYAYVVGYTASTNFPTTSGAWMRKLNTSGVAVTVYDAFVTKLAPNGRSLTYSTYFGGSQNDYGYRIALDASRNAYIVGTSQSIDMPRTNAFGLRIGNNGTNAINFDAFLSKLNVQGYPDYTVQFGGTGNDVAWDVAVDPANRPFVIGTTASTNFPVVHPFDLLRSYNSGNKDVFIVAFNTNASPVLYSGYLGGGGDDWGYAIAVDGEANAYISGMTVSAAFPTTSGAFARSISGARDSFLAKIRLFDPMLMVQMLDGSFQITWPATAPDYALQFTTNLAQLQVWTPVDQTPALTNGQYLVTFPSTNSSTLFRLQKR